MTDYYVTVCDACLRASCWHMEFQCERSIEAGTRMLAASELRKLGREHESHYSRERLLKVCGVVSYTHD